MNYIEIQNELSNNRKIWLITGVAGFIGSHLLEKLLKLNQKVVGLDNYSTGYKKNLDQIKRNVSKEEWNNFRFIKGDIRNLNDCNKAMYFNENKKKLNKNQVKEKVQYVLHQAALGSVPRSIKDPLLTNENNITGFINIIVASRDAKVENFVYAASSSAYGDNQNIPKVENKIGKQLSIYAVTKYTNELYAEVFFKNYKFNSIGLRYFNVFGPRQNEEGEYAAVIPKWISNIINGKEIYINGDGKTSRDFSFIDNIVQANILAACSKNESALNQVYNIACGENISLEKLYTEIKINIKKYSEKKIVERKIKYREERVGDVKHSKASIEKARKRLLYKPEYNVKEGLKRTVIYYLEKES